MSTLNCRIHQQKWSTISRSQNLPFGPVTKGKDELEKNESKVNVFQHRIDNGGSLISKRKCSSTILWSLRTDEIHNNASCKPEGR